MTIHGKPTRVPRKIKKKMGDHAYNLLMKSEHAIWRADIRLDTRTDPWTHRNYGHNIFIPIS